MADLPTIAQRLNDVEVAANAPLTETFFRRVGSNVNFLLDFLGVSNGETTPSGSLNDLALAIDLIDGHTMDLQATFASQPTGVQSIGTFTQTKFVQQVLYAEITSTSPNPLADFIVDDSLSASITPMLNIDGGGNANMAKHDARLIDFQYGNDVFPNQANNQFSKMIPSSFTSGFDSYTSNNPILVPYAIIDWRDSGTSFVHSVNFGGGFMTVNDTIRFYREYRLDIGSLGF